MSPATMLSLETICRNINLLKMQLTWLYQDFTFTPQTSNLISFIFESSVDCTSFLLHGKRGNTRRFLLNLSDFFCPPFQKSKYVQRQSAENTCEMLKQVYCPHETVWWCSVYVKARHILKCGSFSTFTSKTVNANKKWHQQVH
jgi:hypothetical protein